MYFKMHLIFPEKLALVFRWIFYFGKEARAGWTDSSMGSWNCIQLSTTGSGQSVQVNKSKTTPEKSTGEKFWWKVLTKPEKNITLTFIIQERLHDQSSDILISKEKLCKTFSWMKPEWPVCLQGRNIEAQWNSVKDHFKHCYSEQAREEWPDCLQGSTANQSPSNALQNTVYCNVL